MAARVHYLSLGGQKVTQRDEKIVETHSEKERTGTEKYIIWCRGDGYVAASANRAPAGWRGSDGKEVTFEILGERQSWSEAHDLIAAQAS